MTHDTKTQAQDKAAPTYGQVARTLREKWLTPDERQLLRVLRA